MKKAMTSVQTKIDKGYGSLLEVQAKFKVMKAQGKDCPTTVVDIISRITNEVLCDKELLDKVIEKIEKG